MSVKGWQGAKLSTVVAGLVTAPHIPQKAPIGDDARRVESPNARASVKLF
jgi:hypothetical protein